MIAQASVYRHYKGGYYQIIPNPHGLRVVGENGNSTLVLYRPLRESPTLGDVIFARPMEEFFGEVEPGVARFEDCGTVVIVE